MSMDNITKELKKIKIENDRLQVMMKLKLLRSCCCVLR